MVQKSNNAMAYLCHSKLHKIFMDVKNYFTGVRLLKIKDIGHIIQNFTTLYTGKIIFSACEY